MAAVRDITGKRSGRLTAVRPTDKRTNSGSAIWLCHCSCGGVTEVSANHIVNQHTTSCGCLKDVQKNIRGRRFGTVEALCPTHLRDHGSVFWVCRCDCGQYRLLSLKHLYTLQNRGITTCRCKRKPLEKRAELDHQCFLHFIAYLYWSCFHDMLMEDADIFGSGRVPYFIEPLHDAGISEEDAWAYAVGIPLEVWHGIITGTPLEAKVGEHTATLSWQHLRRFYCYIRNSNHYLYSCENNEEYDSYDEWLKADKVLWDAYFSWLQSLECKEEVPSA